MTCYRFHIYLFHRKTNATCHFSFANQHSPKYPMVVYIIIKQIGWAGRRCTRSAWRSVQIAAALSTTFLWRRTTVSSLAKTCRNLWEHGNGVKSKPTMGYILGGGHTQHKFLNSIRVNLKTNIKII